MPTGYLSREIIRQRTARHDRGPGRVQRVDRIAFDADLESKIVHENGMVDYHGVATRGGVAFIYEEPEGEVREFRPWSEVSDPASLKGLVVAPYTVDHPGDGVDDDMGLGEVTVANARGLVHGAVLSVEPDEQTGLVKVWIRVWTKEAIAAIEGGKVELSCGYTTKLLDWRLPEEAELVRAMQLGPELGVAANGERYDYVQTDIRYNHISGVDQGRAGPVARLRTDKANMLTKTTIKIDKRGQYSVPTWLFDAAVVQAKAHTDAGEVLAVEIEGREPMTLPMEMIDQMLAAIGIGAAKPSEAGPSLPEPELEPPITADVGEEEEPITDAGEDEEEGKMDAKAITRMIKDGIAAAMPAAAARVTDAVTTRSRDRAALERQAAVILGPAFDYRAHKDHALAVEVLRADESPKLAQAQALAERARVGDAKAAGKLEAIMEAAIDRHRDSMDSSGDLGRAMFEVAVQDNAEPADERPAWEKKNDSLTRTSQGQTPTEADKAA